MTAFESLFCPLDWVTLDNLLSFDFPNFKIVITIYLPDRDLRVKCYFMVKSGVQYQYFMHSLY